MLITFIAYIVSRTARGLEVAHNGLNFPKRFGSTPNGYHFLPLAPLSEVREQAACSFLKMRYRIFAVAEVKCPDKLISTFLSHVVETVSCLFYLPLCSTNGSHPATSPHVHCAESPSSNAQAMFQNFIRL